MKLVAIQQGFYRGSRIRVGQEFDWAPVKKDARRPKWAAPADEASRKIRAQAARAAAQAGDTKPTEAQAAAAAKALDLQEQQIA